jgi:hypothetical protein
MLKLKNIMGIGAVIIVIFAALITVINQPTPALSLAIQSSLIARGSTPPANTAWQAYGTEGIFVDVDTSSAGFRTTPIYITSLGGLGYHWETTGATSIYTPTPQGFTVYIRFAPARLITPALANEYGWHINWIAVAAPV